MNKILTLLWCCAALLLASCDSGNIHEEMATTTREGLTVRMTGRLRGAESWSDRYQVVLAAFADGTPRPMAWLIAGAVVLSAAMVVRVKPR